MLVRKIEVHPYDATWPIQFEREAKQLRTIFGEQLIAIDHIGSTSIPQLCAKPVIDILITVKHDFIQFIDEKAKRWAQTT